MSIDWIKNFKCRCSAISKMMAEKQGFEALTLKQEITVSELEAKQASKGLTEPQQKELDRLIAKRETSKAIVLSDICIEVLMDAYAWQTERMFSVSKETMETLSMNKGKKQESQAVALLNFVDDVEYKVHKDRIENEYLSGEIDIYLGESVYNASKLTDVKNAWDYPGFLKKINNGLENGQREQVAGYGLITGAEDLEIANCLVDCTEENIEEVKWKVAKKFKAVTIESPEFLKEWAKWERSMRFEHIDPFKRVHKIKIEPFTEFEREKVYEKVRICRTWLQEFHERFENKNKNVSLVQNGAL